MYVEYIYFNNKTKKYIKSHQNIIKIGITGSNGKTSIKNILYFLIKDNITTVVTPQNFNTPKGIKYTICNLCANDTKCIIFEMGAKRIGDIKKLCKMTDINMGVLSNISPQHIETFKTIDNIFKTKTELPNYLDKKLCVFNFNDKLSYKAYKNKQGKKILVGIENYPRKIITRHGMPPLKIATHFKIIPHFNINVPTFYLYAKNIKIKNGFTHFTLMHNHTAYILKTQLLGHHNISNILQATAIALSLGVDMSTIAKRIIALTPTPHRLELIQTRINILDDSYNCSISSAQNSLKVLSSFPNRKVCCTPGIIEGGKMQAELNTKLAKLLQKYSDMQIIVGKTNRPAFESILKKNAYYVDTLKEAETLFTHLNSGDTLLLLNDLPDDYN